MPFTKNHAGFDPLLKLLVVDAACRSPVRPTDVVVTFALYARDGRPREPPGEHWQELALALAEARDGEVRIDPDGVVSIDVGAMNRRPHPRLPPRWRKGWPARVEVRAHGYLPVVAEWIEIPMRAADEPYRFELSSAPILAGRVLDEGAAPVAGVELELVRRIEEGRELCVCSCFGVPYRDDNELHARTTTDAAGVFSLPYTEDATLRVRARALGRTPVETEPFTVHLATPPAPRELVMTVPDGGIEGTVRAFDGAPTARALVVCCRADGFAQRVTTDAEGRYRLALPPGRYRVNRGNPLADGWTATTRDVSGVSLWGGPGDAPAVDPTQFAVEVRGGGFTSWDLDPRRPHDAALIVRVDAAGEDPASYPVYLRRVPGDRAAELAWPRGECFDFLGGAPALFPELPPGRYEVSVGGEVVEVELPAGELTEFEIALSTATVAGRLLDADGAGVVARLELDDPEPVREGWPQSAGNDTESDADGSFTFHIVWPGECRLRVYVDRGGTETLVLDDVLTVPCRGRHEPVIRLERPV